MTYTACLTGGGVAEITIQRELLAHCWPEVLPLCERHKEEIAHYQDIALDVDVELYERIEQAGMIRFFTARDGGKLIGYELVMVSPNLHYAQSLQARVDVLYIAPEHRRSGSGIRLISFADDALRNEGVQVCYHHVKHAHDFSPVLTRLGYESIETIWGRRLDKKGE